MAYANPSVIPGQALPPQNLTFAFDDKVDKVLITTGPVTPVLSKTLGFDMGPIPPGTAPVKRPFLAVTQDGRGNVVYDAGYTKYLDTTIGATPPTTFLGLKPGHRFLHNAIIWASNKAKVLQGNKSVLILGSGVNGEDYDVEFPAVSPSQRSYAVFKLVCDIAGYTLTVKNRTSYGGDKINPTRAELDQYACIILVSMSGTANIQTNTRVTETAINELVFARATGTGIVVLTDHCGDNYTSLEDAVSRITVFPVMAQAVVQHFGTWFTGMVNRSNILVGDLRAESGDHPLYNGLLDSDNIGAGLSESLVMVVDRDGIPKDQVQPVNMNTDGQWLVNVLVILKDGTAYVESYRYFIISSGDTNIVDWNNSVILGNQYNTGNQLFQMGLQTTNPDYQSMIGEILKNGYYMCSFAFNNGVTTYQAPGGADQTFTYKPGDVITFSVREPFLYNLSVTVISSNVPFPFQPASMDRWLRSDYPTLTLAQARTKVLDLAIKYFRQPNDVTSPTWWWLPKINSFLMRTANGILKPADVTLFVNDADFQANKPPFGIEGQACVIRDTMSVWIWRDHVLSWTPATQASGKGAIFIFGLGRLLHDIKTNNLYRITADSITPM